MAKKISFSSEVYESLRKGVIKTASAVKVTLGPRGRAAVIDKGWGAPSITTDGASVCEDIELENGIENMGAALLKEAAKKTADYAGDGTTTATVLAEAIFLEGLKKVVAGVDAMALARGIKACTDAVVKQLHKDRKQIDPANRDDIMRVATIAANGDERIAHTITEAMMKAGKDGVVTVEDGKGLETELKHVEGMQFDRGYLSPYFITNPEAMEVVLKEPWILIHEDKISSVKKLVPLMEKVAKTKKPLLVIAEDVEGEALALLVVNKLKGILECAAVKAPGYGERRKAMLGDIAVLTGGKAIFKDLGIDLETVGFEYLGRAKKITIDADNTTIFEGAGDSKAIADAIEQIRREYEKSDSEYDKEKLQERMAKLAGGICEIEVGAATETEMKAKKTLTENALAAVRAAIEEGILPGGGVGLIRARSALDKLKLQGDEVYAREIFYKALTAPLGQIAANAGFDPGIAISKVSEGKGDFGFNAEKLRFEKLFEAGIVDPVKVTRSALQNAGSVAALLLTTSVTVGELPEKEVPSGMRCPSGMM